VEDFAVIAGLIAAVNHPLVFLGILVVFLLLLIWLMPKLWRGIKRVLGAIGRLFGGGGQEPPVRVEPPLDPGRKGKVPAEK
jgi:hypothetical protein